MLTIHGNGTNRVIHVAAGNTVIAGLTITGGSLTSSFANDGGGGIANTGTGGLTLSDVIVTGNSASMSGGQDNQGGGGVFNFGGPLVINRSQITNNTLTIPPPLNSAGSEKGGGGVFTHASDLLISDSSISNNSANLQGGASIGAGGLFVSTAALPGPKITRTTIDSNHLTTSSGQF